MTPVQLPQNIAVDCRVVATHDVTIVVVVVFAMCVHSHWQRALVKQQNYGTILNQRTGQVENRWPPPDEPR